MQPLKTMVKIFVHNYVLEFFEDRGGAFTLTALISKESDGMVTSFLDSSIEKKFIRMDVRIERTFETSLAGR